MVASGAGRVVGVLKTSRSEVVAVSEEVLRVRAASEFGQPAMVRLSSSFGEICSIVRIASSGLFDGLDCAHK